MIVNIMQMKLNTTNFHIRWKKHNCTIAEKESILMLIEQSKLCVQTAPPHVPAPCSNGMEY